MKYYVKTFKFASDVVAWFNDPQNADKELISVCVSSPTCCDSAFYAYYKMNYNKAKDFVVSGYAANS